MNYFKPSILDDEDLLKGLKNKNPEAGEIDNSPGLVGQIAQAALKAGATAIGGKAGEVVADGINENYNKSQEMPAAGATPQQQMAVGPAGSPLQGGPLAIDTSNMVASNAPLNPVVPMTVTDLDMNNNTPAWKNYILNNKDGRYQYKSRFDRYGKPISLSGSVV